MASSRRFWGFGLVASAVLVRSFVRSAASLKRRHGEKGSMIDYEEMGGRKKERKRTQPTKVRKPTHKLQHHVCLFVRPSVQRLSLAHN